MTATDLSRPTPAVAAPGNRSAPGRRPARGWRLLGYAALVLAAAGAAAAVLLDGRLVAEDQQRRLHHPDHLAARPVVWQQLPRHLAASRT